jgi:hypothetical protein
MKVETRTKVITSGIAFLACLILSGCFEEQSYFMNKRQYYVPLEGLINGANEPGQTGEHYQQQEIQRYALVVQDALYYVHKHSTERMKKHISRGQLVIGMNQKEVLACLHTTQYRDGLPVPSRTFNSKYGKYETWILGGSSAGHTASSSPPKYALDFKYFILTGIHEPLDVLVENVSDTDTAGSHDTYYKDAYEAMDRMHYVSRSKEDEYAKL